MDIYIGKGGRVLGPYDPDEVSKRLGDSRYDGGELAWHEGLDEWANVRGLELTEAVEAIDNVEPDIYDTIDILGADDQNPPLDGCTTCSDVIDRVASIAGEVGTEYRVTQVLFIDSSGKYYVLNTDTHDIYAADWDHLSYCDEISDNHKIGLTLSINGPDRCNLANCGISDVSALTEQTQLTWLNLSGNEIGDVGDLSGLKQLKELHLQGNQLTDVSALKELGQLTKLDLSKNKLTDLSELKELTQLEWLNLSKNTLSDLSVLKELTQLEWLNLEKNRKLTKAQIEEVQKALPNCEILSNPKK